MAKFVQHIRIKTSKIDELLKLSNETPKDAMIGNPTSTILADRDNPGHYVISVVFDSADDAMKNNDLPETHAFAQRMQALVDGEPGWGNYDVIRED